MIDPNYDIEDIANIVLYSDQECEPLCHNQGDKQWSALKALISGNICPIVISNQLPEAVSAVYMSERKSILLNCKHSMKEILTSQTDIKDVVELLNLSGCDLTIDVDETAKTLLNKVYIAANESEKGSTKRRTLFKLAETLQERTELLPLITYISWIIQLKIQFSKELSQQRTQLRSEYRSKQSEIDDAQKTVDQLGREMTDIARCVREYWSVPIAELGVELTSYYYEKKQLPNLFLHCFVIGEL